MHPTSKLILAIEKIIRGEWGYESGVDVCGVTWIPENRYILLLLHMGLYELKISDVGFQELTDALYEFLECVDPDTNTYTTPFEETFTLGNPKELLIEMLEGAKFGTFIEKFAKDHTMSSDSVSSSSSPIGGSESE